ncbi:fumarylacetoacetate hydrolase family protein [Propylenella binzhouense]|uniref:Fumarylacetoacetase-like C-terminal domain-containing protein n=1 Tax=Propylenella binzhouense TaxID=2555902 RepID=A0A964WSE3_9HYPH|nr:hypothetical protein [Propylenella binzhouense]
MTVAAVLLDDPRIARGMAAQLEARETRMRAGERPIGWKAGFGAPAALERLALAGPLIGFMTDRSLVPSGAAVSIGGWSKPVAEPEIAIVMGADLEGGAGEDAARAAIAGIGPAIELADLDRPPDDVEAILSGNIYHRHVVLADPPVARSGADLAGLTGRVGRNGSEIASTTELEANTGTLVAIVRRAAETLAGFGMRLRKGDVLIAGSIVPPLFLDAGDREVACILDPIGGVAVRLG